MHHLHFINNCHTKLDTLVLDCFRSLPDTKEALTEAACNTEVAYVKVLLLRALEARCLLICEYIKWDI